MSTKAQIKTPAKTPVATAAARIPQPPVAEPEHEADRPDSAAQVEAAARLGHTLGAVGVDSPRPPIIQRQEIPEEEEEELQLKREPAALQRQEQPEEEEEEELMLKPDVQRVGAEGGPVSPEVEATIQRARGGGQPLESAVQVHMSEALGHNFNRVRVHTDSEADDLNQQLQAKAFTAGSDIFFKGGAYEPGSSSGRELIAHELSHVVQQGRGRAGGGVGMCVGSATDAAEQEASRVAKDLSSPRAQRRQLGQQGAAAVVYQGRPDAALDAAQARKAVLESPTTHTRLYIQRVIERIETTVDPNPKCLADGSLVKGVEATVHTDGKTNMKQVRLKRLVSAWASKRESWGEKKQYEEQTTGKVTNVYDEKGIKVTGLTGLMWQKGVGYGSVQEDGPKEEPRNKTAYGVKGRESQMTVLDSPGLVGLLSRGSALYEPPAEFHAVFWLTALEMSADPPRPKGSSVMHRYNVDIEREEVAEVIQSTPTAQEPVRPRRSRRLSTGGFEESGKGRGKAWSGEWGK
jgi:hypothetical protein